MSVLTAVEMAGCLNGNGGVLYERAGETAMAARNRDCPVRPESAKIIKYLLNK